MNNQFEVMPWDICETDSQNDAMALAARQAELSYAAASLGVFQDTLRAARTKQAMDNVARLAMLEAQYLRDAPAGKDEYRLLVRAFAERAALDIGW